MSAAVTFLLALCAPLVVNFAPSQPILLVVFGLYVLLVLMMGLTVKSLRQGRFPRFSLRSMFLVIGLGLCLAVLLRDGGPWQLVHRFPGHNSTVLFSPDARVVATIENVPDPPIEIWEAHTGRRLQTVRQPGRHSVNNIAFSPDGKALLMLIYGGTGNAGVAHLVDWNSGKEIRTWSAQNTGRISARGDRFCMHADDSLPSGPAVRVFQIDQDEPLIEIRKSEPWHPTLEDVISTTGRYLLVRDKSDIAYLWDVDAKKKLGTITGADPDTTRIVSVFAQFSNDDRYLAICTKRGVDVWDVERFERIGRWEPIGFYYLSGIEWSPRGDRLFATYFMPSTGPKAGKQCSFLISREGQEIAETYGSSAAFSPNGERIAVQFGRLSILDARTGSRLATLGYGPNSGMAPPLARHRSIFWSPDGRWLLNNGEATVWHRQRDEHWYGVFSMPAFWGTAFFYKRAVFADHVHGFPDFILARL